MAEKRWTVTCDDMDHVVSLEWTYFGGRRDVRVDDETVRTSTRPLRWRSEQHFTVSGHSAVVRTRPYSKAPWLFVVSLEVDGAEIASDSAISTWEA